ncbi:MAG: hypothetical protein WD278_05705 [Pirellulales bacterium]
MNRRLTQFRRAPFCLVLVAAIGLASREVAGQTPREDSPRPKGGTSAGSDKAAPKGDSDGGVWWYRIAKPKANHVSGGFQPRKMVGGYGETLTVPETDLGSFFLDVQSGRFVYHLFRDPDQGRLFGLGTPVVGRPVDGRPLLACATGFDGSNYWDASFTKPFESRFHKGSAYLWQAAKVDVYRSLPDQHPHDWLTYAPLHALFARIDCKGWHRDAIVEGFSRSMYGRVLKENDKKYGLLRGRERAVAERSVYSYLPQYSKDRREFRGGEWSYLVELDNQVPAIKNCEVSTTIGMGGDGPGVAIAPWYSLTRERQVSELPESLFEYKSYIDGETAIELHGGDNAKDLPAPAKDK